MIPTSDDLEVFFERINNLYRDLSKLKSAEVRDVETLATIKALSKEWLRLSEALRSAEAIPHDNLSSLDKHLKDILQSTNSRSRASAYRKKLMPVLSTFTEQIVIPMILHEGSPAQVAARRLQ